jgi:DNA helicase HerA-like ATPase
LVREPRPRRGAQALSRDPDLARVLPFLIAYDASIDIGDPDHDSRGGLIVMSDNPGVLLGKGEKSRRLLLKFANRHGLIAGATGTGKTVTLQVLAEGFSAQGVPVFMADVKGDLSGVSRPGDANPKAEKRAAQIGLEDYSYRGFPTIYWDLFGEQGHPVRTTITEVGPLLLSRLLGLNDVQEGVLNIAFKLADDRGLLILDLKDLRALISFVGEQSKALTTEYGTVRKASVGAIQRRLLMLEQQGAEQFFGEPAVRLNDFMRTTSDGYGFVNVLAADRLMQYPVLYSTFMLWLMSELFEDLPEVGDPDKPRLVFFFDEAHLLFDDAPKALLDKVEQVVRLIRSKGVGVYFISQNPLDIPEDILGQLGNRVQHALRAFTPRDQKAVRAAAQTFRPNPKLDTEQVITEMGVGEALVSTLEGEGVPGVVDRTLIRPPLSRMGPVSEAERRKIVNGSPLFGRYEEMIDRESAFEVLKARAEKAAKEAEDRAEEEERGDSESAAEKTRKKTGGRGRQSIWEAAAKSLVRSVASSIGRQISRGVLGTILKRM